MSTIELIKPDFVLIITSPGSPQALFQFNTRDEAIEAARKGAKDGLLEYETKDGFSLIQGGPGVRWDVIERRDVEAQIARAKLMQPGQTPKLPTTQR